MLQGLAMGGKTRRSAHHHVTLPNCPHNNHCVNLLARQFSSREGILNFQCNGSILKCCGYVQGVLEPGTGTEIMVSVYVEGGLAGSADFLTASQVGFTTCTSELQHCQYFKIVAVDQGPHSVFAAHSLLMKHGVSMMLPVEEKLRFTSDISGACDLESSRPCSFLSSSTCTCGLHGGVATFWHVWAFQKFCSAAQQSSCAMICSGI